MQVTSVQPADKKCITIKFKIMKLKRHISRFWILILIACLSSCQQEKTGKSTWYESDVEFFPFQNDEGRYVYVNSKGEEVFNSSYLVADIFRDGIALVEDYDGNWGYINTKGKYIIEPQYTEATSFCNGIAWVTATNCPPQTINKKGKILFAFPEAKFVVSFADGYAIFITADDKFGVVDTQGEIVINPNYSEIQLTPWNGVYNVKNNENKWGCVNLKGETIINPQFDQILADSYNRENIIFKKGKKWGVADSKGQYIINPQFNNLISDKDGYLVLKDYKWGWCDKEGQYTIAPQYKDAKIFGEAGLAPVQTDDGDWGYIDHTGKIIINPQFREADSFNDDYAFVSSNSKVWGVINKEGKYIITPQFEQIYPFMNGVAVVKNTDGYWELINLKGKYLTHSTYISIAKDLQYNYTGGKQHLLASSDYIDIESIANLVDLFLKGINWENTIANINTKYSVSENDFSKTTGVVTLKTTVIPDTYRITENAICNAWSKSSDGWFGYKYKFNDQCLLKAYNYSINLLGRHTNKLPLLKSSIQKKLGLNGDKGSISNTDIEIYMPQNLQESLQLLFTSK